MQHSINTQTFVRFEGDLSESCEDVLAGLVDVLNNVLPEIYVVRYDDYNCLHVITWHSDGAKAFVIDPEKFHVDVEAFLRSQRHIQNVGFDMKDDALGGPAVSADEYFQYDWAFTFSHEFVTD